MKINTFAISSATMGSVLAANLAPRDVWQPAVGASWQIILTGKLDFDSIATIAPNVDIFDIDLYFNTNDGTDKSIIEELHKYGKKVICYFSGGSFEPGRPDSDKFTEADRGRNLTEWPDEQWLNLNSQDVRDIISARISLAAEMGCDGIDPDNVDGYGEYTDGIGEGEVFALTENDSIEFVGFLAEQARNNNLALGLKNAGEIIPSVLSEVQFSVNEECVAVTECSTFNQFIDASKPVFHIEYPKEIPVTDTSGWCTSETEEGGDVVDISSFSTVIKNMDLDGWVQLCDGSTTTTPTTSITSA